MSSSSRNDDSGAEGKSETGKGREREREGPKKLMANSCLVMVPIVEAPVPTPRRRLQKHMSDANSHVDGSQQSTKSTATSRFGALAKRRLSFKESKTPTGGRPQEFSQRR